ncbi:hypothetical protein [uncultured Tateyamaria sp.]|uniref:hypothetical protein n=1 Tax=uncultured Tateyamaria sp. TaxID=455651 RepID=UPI002609DD83|nr:hypothetical protein [uncultured Tateyamaria sp.]
MITLIPQLSTYDVVSGLGDTISLVAEMGWGWGIATIIGTCLISWSTLIILAIRKPSVPWIFLSVTIMLLAIFGFGVGMAGLSGLLTPG